MLATDAISKMQATVTEAMSRLDGNGFVMSVEIDYMNQMLNSVEDTAKAKYVTVSLVVASKDCKKGDEYCMSLGAMIVHGKIDDAQLERDIEGFGKMVNEALEVLEKYENKDEGLAYLTAKANEEYEQLVKKMEDERAKNKRLAMIGNIVFIVGIALLFIVAFLK